MKANSSKAYIENLIRQLINKLISIKIIKYYARQKRNVDNII